MGRDATVDRNACGIRGMRLRAPVLVPAILSLLACLPALSQAPVNAPAVAPAAGEGSTYAIDRWTVDGGGGQSSGGSFAVSGTIAQPDSDPLQPSTGGNFAVTGGFWPGLARGDAAVEVFADGFENP
jgi:hypothetical protein